MTTESADGEVRFDGQVAVITGAGNGLGRSYALAFAARGAAVVVNDLGGDRAGAGASARPAQAVADEIMAAGGRAVPNFDDITAPGAGERVVETAIGAFGRIDILVNNAGVLDNAEFLSCPDDVIRRTVDTHLLGTIAVTRAVLPPLLDQGYGRIVCTSSGAVFGSREGVAYQAAKSGLIAFTRAVAQIGADRGVAANAVLPTAFTRMTSSIPPSPFRDFMESQFTPERVAAAVLLLAHRSFPHTGECFLVGGGRMARLFLGVTEGYVAEEPTPEDFRDQLKAIMSTDGFGVPASRVEEFQSYLPRLGFGADLGRLVAPVAGQAGN
jgi:NAD(P)-dependent dehydrogenase (short-subunit alcohol dehydrogenase family)